MINYFKKLAKSKTRGKKIVIKFQFILIIGLAFLCFWMYMHYDSENKNLKEDYTKLLEQRNNDVADLKEQVDNHNVILKQMIGNEGIYKKDLKNLTEEQLNLWVTTPLKTKQLVKYHGTQLYQLRYTWMIMPIEGYVINSIAEFGGARKHTGFDIAPTKSLAILSATDGKVKETGYDKQAGNYIIIEIEKDDKHYELYYGHLEVIEVEKDQEIKQGQRIGICGETGNYCLGRHLHWSVKENGIIYNPVINTTFGKRVEVRLY